MRMRMPNSIAAWCTILFFLFYGLSYFIPAIPGAIAAILALGAAVFTFLSM